VSYVNVTTHGVRSGIALLRREPSPQSIVCSDIKYNVEHATSRPIARKWHVIGNGFANSFRITWLRPILSDTSNEKCAAGFSSCIGSEAFGVYRSMQFEAAEDKNIAAAFEAFCVGSVNVTYTSITRSTRECNLKANTLTFYGRRQTIMPVRGRRGLHDPYSVIVS